MGCRDEQGDGPRRASTARDLERGWRCGHWPTQESREAKWGERILASKCHSHALADLSHVPLQPLCLSRPSARLVLLVLVLVLCLSRSFFLRRRRPTGALAAAAAANCVLWPNPCRCRSALAAMAGGGCWPGFGSLPFRINNLLGMGSSSLSPNRAAQGDAVLRDDGATPKPKKSLRFPLKAALTASVLATTGDTVAQLVDRNKKRKALEEQRQQGIVEGVVGAAGLVNQATDGVNLWDHDWQRAARMASYGFFIYGPLSQVWYEVLDHFMPLKNLTNLSLKVVANQVILGPIVITLVFAWNKLWEGRLEQLPDLYRTRALQTLLDGWKFWIPASVLNFGMIPLQARVAFMSSCSIFWNFYLSNTMTAGKGKALPTSKSE